MEALLNYFQINKDAIIAVGILLTFITSVFSLYFSWKNNKAVHYVNTVTKNRVDWIYKLRELVAEYVAVTTFDTKQYIIHDDAELSKHFERIKIINQNIRLLLNFSGDIDREIIQCIDVIEEKCKAFYGILPLIEELHDENLSEEHKNDSIASNKYACKYLIKYFKDKGFEFEEKIEFHNQHKIIYEKIQLLKSKYKFDYLLLHMNIMAQIKFIADEIESQIEELTKNTQIYLKFEWNRIKYEAKGKTYYERVQIYDLKELIKKYEDNDYKQWISIREFLECKETIRLFLLNPKVWIFMVAIIAGIIFVA